jgi:probable rRNA maturation factor
MIVIEAPRAKLVLALGKRDLNRFLASATEALGLTGEFSVLLTGDKHLRALNLQFRGMDKATDVLSFPAFSEVGQTGHGGDLAISLDTAYAQAEDRGHPLQMEVKILILHGLLHLAGYDHETDEGQMRRRESLLRKRFALTEGLVERAERRPRRTGAPAQRTRAEAKPRGSSNLRTGLKARSGSKLENSSHGRPRGGKV